MAKHRKWYFPRCCGVTMNIEMRGDAQFAILTCKKCGKKL